MSNRLIVDDFDKVLYSGIVTDLDSWMVVETSQGYTKM